MKLKILSEITPTFKGHEDVTGFDTLDPKKGLGMTTDQWREHKRMALFDSYGDGDY